MCANTYAALMELDYYSSPGTQFNACYDQQDITIVQENRPPFDFTYLVSKYTEQGIYAINKQRKLCNVIANKIALDFSSELAPVVKGMRDNFIPHMILEDNHPRPNSQYYITFGLAAIYFPRDRISQITVARINSKLVNFWLQGEGQSPDPMKLLEQFLIESRWHNSLERKDGLLSRLEVTVLELEKNFSSLMNAWKTKQENSITDCQNQDDRSSLMRQLQKEFKEQFYKTKFGDTESTRGIWLTKLIKSRTNLTLQLRQDIDNYLFALLTPSNQYFSIANARNWLDALQTELNAYQYELEEKIRGADGARNLEELEKKWTQSNRTIQDIEEEFNLPLFNNKNSRVQDEARRAVKDTETAIKHNFNLTVAQEALEIVKVLQQHTQVRASQLTSLCRLVDDLKNYYEKIQATLKQSDSDEMSGEEIFSDEDIDICYNTLLPQNEYRAQVVQITQKILESTGSEQSLAIFLEQNHTNTEQLKQEIDSSVDRLFGSRSADIVQSVIKRFTQKYSSTERAIRLGQILREAQPLLPINLTDPYFHNNPAKKSQLIGFKDTDEPEVRQFHTGLTERLAIPDNELKPTQAEDKVLIVTEYAAFPLRIINGLQQLSKHYYHQRRHPGNAPLHNDRSESFTDIIPPPVPVMQDLQDTFYPCLAFDLIQQNQTTKQLEFQCFDQLRGVYHTASFNPAWKQALQALVNNPNMAAALRELLDGAIADIKHQPARWQGYYLPKLRQFVTQVDTLPDNHINYPYRLRVVGSRGTDANSAQQGIIERFYTKMQEQTQSLPGESTATLNTALPAIASGKELIAGEVEVIEVVNNSFTDSADNRTRRRLELERLKQDVDDAIITEEEYEYERQEILNKYPLRR